MSVFVILTMDKMLYMTHIRQGNIEFSRFKNILISPVCSPEMPYHRLFIKHTGKIYAEKIPAKNSLFCTKLKYLLRMNIPYFRPDRIQTHHKHFVLLAGKLHVFLRSTGP